MSTDRLLSHTFQGTGKSHPEGEAMLNYFITAGWILFDVLICLRTGYMTRPFPPWEWWIWLVAGLALAAGSFIAQWLEGRKHDREMADLKGGQERHSAEHDVLAASHIQLGTNMESLRVQILGLQSVTNTSGEPISKTIEIATEKIGRLEAQVQGMAWRTITAEQRKRFSDAIPKDRVKLQVWRVFCVPIDAEAQSYAKQLLYLLSESGVYASDPDYYQTDARLSRFDKYGCAILVKNPNLGDAQILKTAFDSASIESVITSEGFASGATDNFLAVWVGPKPK